MKIREFSFGSIEQSQNQEALFATLLLALLFWTCTTNANINCGSKPYFESESGGLTLEEKLELLDEQFIVSLSKSECEDPFSGADVSDMRSGGLSGQASRTSGVSQNRIEEGEASVALDENLVAATQRASVGFSNEQQLLNGKQEEELLIADNEEELRRQIQELVDNEKNPEIRRQLEEKLKELK